MTESHIRSEVRRVIAELRPGHSRYSVESRTRLSSLGYKQQNMEQLGRTLEGSLQVLVDWSALDPEDATVGDIEQLVLRSVADKGTALPRPKITGGRPKEPDLRAHMRSDGVL